ncbi:hypothetical protein [Echinicola vietnamensis]|nr:hypothetical protein [Echinicola vietnamensis]
MDKTQLKKDIMPKELVLKLHRDIPPTDWIHKIRLLDEFFDSVAPKLDEDVLFIKRHEQYGFFLWEAGEWSRAIEHYERALTKLEAADNPFLYHIVTLQLITCYQHLENYRAAMVWFETAMLNLTPGHHAFERLGLLEKYVQLLEATAQPFDEKYLPIIQQVVDEAGFPPPEEHPKSAIKSLSAMHLEWNQKLSKLYLDAKKGKIDLHDSLKAYAETCPIGWYRDHVNERL